MEITNTITEGQWFCAVEGIAIAEKISNVYYEEYDNIPQNKNMGDLKMSVVQYRLFVILKDFLSDEIDSNTSMLIVVVR